MRPMSPATAVHRRVQTSASHAPGQAFWQRGLVHARAREWVQAADAFAAATRAAPRDALYWVNLANAQRHAGALPEAEAAARRALKIEAGNVLALQVLGDSLGRMHRYAESLAVFAQLEAGGTLEPDALVQQGAMLQALQRHAEAMQVLLRALAVMPHHLRGHALLADACRDLGLKREAVECMKTVLALDPGNLEALAHLSFEKRHLCDWSDWRADLGRIEQALLALPAGTPRVAAVFGLLSLPLAPALHLRAAQGEAAAIGQGIAPLPSLTAAQVAERKARVPRLGLVSYDFREHPVSQLLVEVLEQLDRSRFGLTLYSSGPDDGSALRARLVQAADAFVDIRGLSDHQAAERVREDGIDILIDLGGHTRGHRLGVFAARPAPLQATHLGYPGSTGASFIDYLIGDPLVTPLELSADYSERIAQMPLTLQPNGRWRPLPQPLQRADVGLPDEAFVLCAFNHTYKIGPEAFDAWCSVLRAVPHAVLWLKETNRQLHDHVLREAAARGIDAHRIVFAPNVAYGQHFSRLALADVFVDTWPYNAHTTAADALWAGVPVVTLHGNSYASRVAASLLDAAGVGELAFGDVDSYTRAITALALEPTLAAAYKQLLQGSRETSPLFDSARWTRGFEALLARMWQRWCEGLPPAHLAAAAA
jgi:predicted O-linked N-acetylglucosamine transferase (SPINDLY family)